MPATIGFISPTGWGNLGDAAIIDSLVHAIRRRMPEARIIGFTLNPDDTRRRHRIEAYPCAAFALPFYAVNPSPELRGADLGAPLTGTADADTHPDAADAPPPPRPGVRDWLRRLPIRGGLRTAAVLPLRLAREPAHVARSREILRDASVVVVAGGGQLDALWGGPFGHPYVLWKWGRLARGAGARFAILSVGTGTLTRASRLFVHRALRLAEYRSFRDERSRDLVGAPELTRTDPIVPDLAYGVPVARRPTPSGPRRVFGISPMNIGHPRFWPEGHARRYEHHTRGFGQLIRRILSRGDEVVIFSTDTDTESVSDTLAACGALSADAQKRLRVARTTTLEALFETLASVHVVVAARLHGVMLSHIAGRAVMAVAHERKVRTLMQDTGQPDLCVDVDAFDVEKFDEALTALARAPELEMARIAAYVDACRARVEAQYDRVLGAPSGYDQRFTSA